jgi:hypothetical protein
VKDLLRSHGPWITDCLDQIEPPHGRSTVTLQIVAATGTPFRVFGRVQDATHRPVSGAQVTVGSAAHRQPYRWLEEHFDKVTTDACGDYELWLDHPWVMESWVEAEGHEKVERPGSDEDAARFRPGRYDFTLK